MTCSQAFGRYLRILRGRKGLSMDDVDALSRSFTDPINKGYLSRCENGRQSISFPKMIALCRIYDVPPEALVEKLELDMELERIGGPETDGLTDAELKKRQVKSWRRWRFWDEYTYARVALHRAIDEPDSGTTGDRTAWIFDALIQLSSAVLKLGKYQLALHELRFIESQSEHLSPLTQAILMDRLSVLLKKIGRIHEAATYSQLALKMAEDHRLDGIYGVLLCNRASMLLLVGDPENAIILSRKANKILGKMNRKADSIRSLLTIAEAYQQQGRYGAARRTLSAAKRVAVAVRNKLHLCYVEDHFGDVDSDDGRKARAMKHWRQAARIARDLREWKVAFDCELKLLIATLENEDAPSARAIQRRITRLLPKVPPELEQVARYKNLLVGAEYREMLKVK